MLKRNWHGEGNHRSHIAQGGQNPVMVYQQLPQGGKELIVNQEQVSLRALDEFFFHSSLITKSLLVSTYLQPSLI